MHMATMRSLSACVEWQPMGPCTRGRGGRLQAYKQQGHRVPDCIRYLVGSIRSPRDLLLLPVPIDTRINIYSYTYNPGPGLVYGIPCSRRIILIACLRL